MNRSPQHSKHSKRYVGVTLVRDGEPTAVEFAEPIRVKMTATPPWVRVDRRRAANKAARQARNRNRP